MTPRSEGSHDAISGRTVRLCVRCRTVEGPGLGTRTDDLSCLSEDATPLAVHLDARQPHVVQPNATLPSISETRHLLADSSRQHIDPSLDIYRHSIYRPDRDISYSETTDPHVDIWTHDTERHETNLEHETSDLFVNWDQLFDGRTQMADMPEQSLLQNADSLELQSISDQQSAEGTQTPQCHGSPSHQ